MQNCRIFFLPVYNVLSAEQGSSEHFLSQRFEPKAVSICGEWSNYSAMTAISFNKAQSTHSQNLEEQAAGTAVPGSAFYT